MEAYPILVFAPPAEGAQAVEPGVEVAAGGVGAAYLCLAGGPAALDFREALAAGEGFGCEGRGQEGEGEEEGGEVHF